ncbi:unnamed protein product [Rotaria socialis]|uniref:Uncharacterized protein n=1 Tax=Rotaria socialis TaxID=392032 RepID=A0A820MYV7_9BILA|nr:unnamed protein product [Rotaria socialis]CAF4383122.1 unnamed protein product [Rotaria socialis]
MEKAALYPDCNFSIWFRSVNENNVTETPLEGRKTGVIPDWIHGSFYQNGPGLFYTTGKRVQHLFDAFALIQKFTIEHGHVTYQNRILQSNSYKKAYQTGRLCYSEYSTSTTEDKSMSSCKRYEAGSTLSWIFTRIQNLINYENDFRTDNAMITIFPYQVNDDKVALFAMTETPTMHEIDPKTIETRSTFNVSEHVPIFSHCAHPVILRDGTILNVGLAASFMGMNYVLFEFPGSSKLNSEDNMMMQCRTLAKIPCRWPINPSYMHTFAVTDNYIILIEQSLCISLTQMAHLTITRGPLVDALVWYENEPVRFRLVNRQSMAEYNEYIYLTKAFFYLHIINAYEDNNHVVLDICTYDTPDMLKCMMIEALENAQQNPDYLKQFTSRPKRFVLPISVKYENGNLNSLNYTTCHVKFLDKKSLWIEPEIIIDIGCELPQIDNFRFYGKFYRFFYGINTDIDYQYCGAIRKIDVLSKTDKFWHETGCYTSEPIFLRNPLNDTEEEDNGVLIMSLLRNSREHEVSLLVLDARDMTEIGRVQFDTNGPAPKSLHGLWIGSGMKFTQ